MLKLPMLSHLLTLQYILLLISTFLFIVPVETAHSRALHQAPFTARVYVALPSNPLYLGPKSYPEMAREIVQSQVNFSSNNRTICVFSLQHSSI